MATPDISNLAQCVAESRDAWLDPDPGPKNPTDFTQLLDRLSAAEPKLPPLYRQNAADPFAKSLRALGSAGFVRVLRRDPDLEQEAGLMLDIAHSILQNGEGYATNATDAFQEVISDLYDGFLSAEDRRGVKPPDDEVLPPLVKWGNPASGPYTWPVDATSSFDLDVAVVNLPPANARRGIMGWAALGHETSGHDVLHADKGLLVEVKNTVRTALQKAKIQSSLPGYWATRIDETASDVLGILNLGPAAAIGVIAYFRGINAALGGKPKLSSVGPGNDPHPADIVRGYLASAVVRLLSFDGAKAWADLLLKETEKDVSRIRLAGVEIPKDKARRSAEIVAQTIATGKFQALEGHSFLDIQDWEDSDEQVAARLRDVLTQDAPLPGSYSRGAYAAHVVAAATTAALARGADIPAIMRRMLSVLKTMHDKNASWGPLYVAHPGDLVPHRFVVGRTPKQDEPAA